uniref:Oleoyl-[acyl-carrier-protein] hydrolase n=1 Tax=Panagrolaimus sp. JU765 TaxID=591449 RepID=A0AC34Q5W7_9BILA
MPKNSLPAQIVELCRKKSAKANVYCIHAIGGTVYPFYPFIHVLDDDFNLFAIPFDSNYAVDSIDDLAHFYAKKILEHSMGEPVVLVGYSLGGMLAHSMARFFLDSGLVQQDKIQVVMFDSWTIGTNQLNLDSIKSYLEKQFSSFPDSQDLLDSALKLSKFLTKHEFRFHPKINISLFKASKLTDSALKHAIL